VTAVSDACVACNAFFGVALFTSGGCGVKLFSVVICFDAPRRNFIQLLRDVLHLADPALSQVGLSWEDSFCSSSLEGEADSRGDAETRADNGYRPSAGPISRGKRWPGARGGKRGRPLLVDRPMPIAFRRDAANPTQWRSQRHTSTAPPVEPFRRHPKSSHFIFVNYTFER
jgi:hypothetical protein